MEDYEAIRYKSALAAFQKLAEEGHLDSQHRLAMMYRFGLGTETNYVKAVEWLFKAANQGLKDSQYALGLMYRNGWGVSKNNWVANEWFKRAGQPIIPENSEFTMTLAEQSRQADRLNEAINDYEAIRYKEVLIKFKELADKGHPEGQHRLAMMYRFGLGTETDYEKAVEWLFKAANQGFQDSQYALGLMYRNGWGVSKNEEVANFWFEKAKETK